MSSSSGLEDSPPTGNGLSAALQARLKADGVQGEALPELLQSWGLRSLRQLAWTPPERLGRLLDQLPLGQDEGDVAALRALNDELWRERAPAEPSLRRPMNSALVGKPQARRPGQDLGGLSSREAEALKIDWEAREAVPRMVGSSGRLKREELQTHFAAVGDRGFSLLLSHLPFKALLQAAEQATEEPWYPLLTRDVLNTSLLREDWAARDAWMKEQQPAWSLVPLYDQRRHGALRAELLEPRPLAVDELSHPRLEPVPGPVPTTRRQPGPAFAPSLTSFEFIFNEFTNHVLEGVFELSCPGSRIFAAGGAVLACFQEWAQAKLNPMYHLAASAGDLYRLLRQTPWGRTGTVAKTIGDFVGSNSRALGSARSRASELWLPDGARANGPSWGFATSDIDLFICTENEAGGLDLMKKVLKKLRANVTKVRREREIFEYPEGEEEEEGAPARSWCPQLRLMRTANAISIWCGWPLRTIQVMVVMYRRMDEVLSFFDLDCISLGYDGSNVWALPRTLRALQTGYNFVEPAKLRRWSTGPRILKYRQRGFGTVFFEICRHCPRCDLPETLDEETARRVANLQATTSASKDFGYGEVSLPFASRLRSGQHLDEYVRSHEIQRARIREQAEARALGLWPPESDDPLVGRFHYVPGDDSASDQHLEGLLEMGTAGSGREMTCPAGHALVPFVTPRGGETYDCDLHHGPLPPGAQVMSCRLCNFDACENCIARLRERMPPVRWKHEDLHASRRGNEFLPRCYMCRSRINPAETLAERPRCCQSCEELNRQKREQRADLSGKVAIVTGGRVNIGFATALRLLRLGAEVAVTTRFPRACLRRFSAEKDANVWLGRLWVFGVDFRIVPHVVALAEQLKARFQRLDILVNNAAQTLRPPSSAFKELVLAEAEPLEPHLELRLVRPADPEVLQKLIQGEPGPLAMPDAAVASSGSGGYPSPATVAQEPSSWTAKLGEISWVESLEVQLVNVQAPFILLGTLKPLLTDRSAEDPGEDFPGDLLAGDPPARNLSTNAVRRKKEALARRMRFVINVTSQEGQFRSSSSKGPAHPHTNMAKASLNMLTCSVADELARAGVVVVSVDTGWISQMKPEHYIAAEPHLLTSPPLTAEDGAARVLDPIISALNGGPVSTGCVLRNFEPMEW